MCVGNWSRVGLVKGKGHFISSWDELIGDEDELPEDWDKICLKLQCLYYRVLVL